MQPATKGINSALRGVFYVPFERIEDVGQMHHEDYQLAITRSQSR